MRIVPNVDVAKGAYQLYEPLVLKGENKICLYVHSQK